jgi:hypothetical protein
MTLYDSLHPLLDNACLLFCCDWLGSGLRIGHFFSFRCPLVNTPQLNTPRLNSLIILLQMKHSSLHCSLYSPVRIHGHCLFLVRFRKNICWVFVDKRKCFSELFCWQWTSALAPISGVQAVLTEPLPSNGHIRRIIRPTVIWLTHLLNQWRTSPLRYVIRAVCAVLLCFVEACWHFSQILFYIRSKNSYGFNDYWNGRAFRNPRSPNIYA